MVDLLGLSANSPFPGRSLAACWTGTPGTVAEESTSPAFSERADLTSFQPEPEPGHLNPRLQMSVVAEGMHYIRDGAGKERLYDLGPDPFERVDLMESGAGKQRVDAYRGKLLKVLNDNPGTAEVEHGYLERFRQQLGSLAAESPPSQVAIGP